HGAGRLRRAHPGRGRARVYRVPGQDAQGPARRDRNTQDGGAPPALPSDGPDEVRGLGPEPRAIRSSRLTRNSSPLVARWRGTRRRGRAGGAITESIPAFGRNFHTMSVAPA